VKRRNFLAGLAGLTVAAGTGSGIYLAGRRTPLTTTRTIGPAKITKVGQTYFVDFGKIRFGNVIVMPSKAGRGFPIKVRLGEKLDSDGRIDRKPFGTVRYYEAETVLAAPYSPPLTPADQRGVEKGRPAMPFRYVEVDGWQGEFAPDSIVMEAVVSNAYAESGNIRFTGNSANAVQLNRLMELGRHTMEATSFMGIFIDGDRERLPYSADALINQLGWYATVGESTVPRRTIEALLHAPTWPSEWMVQIIFMVWEDYRATGDKIYLRSVFDKLKIFTLAAFVDESGLVTTRNEELAKRFVADTRADYLEDIVDWPPVERDGYEMRPYNTVVNAFVYAGLSRMRDMALELGRSDEAKEYDEKAARLLQAMWTKLIDPQTGLFLDGIGSSHSAAHATFFPLAFGAVPPANIESSLRWLESRIERYGGGFPCSVYGAQFLLEALFRNGGSKQAIDLMLNTTMRGWLHMLDAYDATVTHEAWDVSLKENIDWTHAWGSAFLNITHRFILGAEALSPGWNRWTLRPDPIVGESMVATIPTPHGSISVTVDADRRTIDIRSPKEASFTRPEQENGQEWEISSIEVF
jgi:hypothetical protein